MNIQIICIGKLKEKYWTDAVGEYMKRLSSYATVKIVEIKESRLPDKAGLAEEEKVKLEEGREILKAIKDGTYVVTLEIQGKQLSSEELAAKIEGLGIEGKSDVAFVIGSSHGLSDEVKKAAALKFSMGRITMPHQLARLVLTEQIYRACTINAGMKYHK